MPRDTQRTRRDDVKHKRIVVSLVMGIGLVLCLINAVVLVHIVDNDDGLVVASLSTTTAIATSVASKGKERLLRILNEAGIHDISHESLEQLPTWDQVVELYGDSPKIVGLETCQTFRETIDPTKALIGPAGPFNSGTNLLAELLIQNCVLTKRHTNLKQSSSHKGKGNGSGNGIRWQVNWGKHSPARFRLQHYIDKTITNNTVMMPIVAVRDPYTWMQSMCRLRYAAHWFHPPGHCPNLIPNDVDFQFLEYAPYYRRSPRMAQQYHHKDPWLIDNVENTANFTRTSTVVPLYVKYKLANTTHLSLAHLWTDWYEEYLQATYPRIFVRMEDLVFHGRNVTETICACVGGKHGDEFRYVTDSAKHGKIHGKDKTTLLDAMIRYGSAEQLSRLKGMTNEDIAYARTVFRKDLMELFGYRHAQS